MAKKDSFYFENFVSAAECSCTAAAYLKECLTNYDYGNIDGMLKKMHEYEHEGDSRKHEMTEALAKAFVTPMDREDMAEISHNIDDVTDCIEEVLQRLYVNRIQSIMPEAVEFAEGCTGNILSEGTIMGDIQITSAGQPILMMADCQTVGGYTKLGHVISADLPAAAQLRPGAKVRFELISVEAAQQILRQLKNTSSKMISSR